VSPGDVERVWTQYDAEVSEGRRQSDPEARERRRDARSS